MSKTILTNADGFTPIIDAIVQELGLMSAVVFGRIWRYCQMEDQVCKASLETIGDGIGVDRATVMRHAKELCEAGYLKDLTPDLRNRPHVYADTGKAGLTVSISGVAQSNVKKVSVAESNTTVAQSNVTVAESKLNIDSKIEVKKEIDIGDAEIFTALSLLTGGGLNSNTPKFVDAWKETHTCEWILKAIGVARENKARSVKYVDEILLGWEANGYPKSREERVKEKRTSGNKSAAAEPKTGGNQDAAKRVLESIYVQRRNQRPAGPRQNGR